MDARGIIYKLRLRRSLSAEELKWFAKGLADGGVSDAQAGAFAMAACLNGMTTPERVALTLAMRDSGHVMAWDLPGPVVDKHSTGGLGDCTSLLIAPMLAACGVFNPMISGRGLGHTGGTLDKLEAIPGLDTNVDEARFRRIVAAHGCAIVAASADLAPADKRLYAVRDVTSTVESIDLITASILSKKLAAGLGALVLDVKVGSGAFMADMAAAEALAQSLVETAQGAGCRTRALITDMSQPLAGSVGNALEVAEAMEVLEGSSMDSPLEVVSIGLVAHLLHLCGAVPDIPSGTRKATQALSDGSAAAAFGAMVADLGGPADFIDKWRDLLPKAPVQRDVFAQGDGHVAAIDGRALGMAVVRMGGGQMKEADRIDPSVGLSHVAPLGADAGPQMPLCRIHADDDAAADATELAVRAAFTLGDRAPPPDLIRKVMS